MIACKHDHFTKTASGQISTGKNSTKKQHRFEQASPADFARVLDFAFAAMLGMYLLTACVGYGANKHALLAPSILLATTECLPRPAPDKHKETLQAKRGAAFCSLFAGVFGDQTAAPILSNFPDHVQRGSLGAGVCVIKLIVAVSIYCSYPILMNVLVLVLFLTP